MLVASAFHPSYGEKMLDCAETATNFKGCVIVRKGLEGERSIPSLVLPPTSFLHRPASLLPPLSSPSYGTYQRRKQGVGSLRQSSVAG